MLGRNFALKHHSATEYWQIELTGTLGIAAHCLLPSCASTVSAGQDSHFTIKPIWGI